MLNHFLKVVLLFLLFYSCHSSSEAPKEYPRMIGDISHDPAIDTTDFKLCYGDQIAVQYYAMTKVLGAKPFLNEQKEVQTIFEANYNSKIAMKESGLLRIRFLVNCQGVPGRFRMIGMDENYQSKTFDKSITNQILSISQHKIKWKPFVSDKLNRDYYMYLIFKIDQGKIIEILP